MSLGEQIHARVNTLDGAHELRWSPIRLITDFLIHCHHRIHVRVPPHMCVAVSTRRTKRAIESSDPDKPLKIHCLPRLCAAELMAPPGARARTPARMRTSRLRVNTCAMLLV